MVFHIHTLTGMMIINNIESSNCLFTCTLNVFTTTGIAKKKTPCVATQLGQQGKDKERLTCPHCKFVCYRIQNFTRHLRGHEKPDFYKCDLCDYTHKNKGEVSDTVVTAYCYIYSRRVYQIMNYLAVCRLLGTRGTHMLRRHIAANTVDPCIGMRCC